MHKISLKDWVILLTIVPTTLIGITIASYFSYSRYAELNHYLTERSLSIIEPLAITSTEAIIKNQRKKLRHIVGYAHRSQSTIIKSITVFTKDNQLFVTSAYHGDISLLRLGAGVDIPTNTTISEIDNYLIFRTPIIDEEFKEDTLNANGDSHQIVGYIAMQIDKNQIKFDQQSQVLIAFSIVIFGVLINGIFAIRLIKNVTRPVNSMVQAVDRIREGKLESRISGQLIGELNFLKNGVNAMAQSLGDYHDEMQKSIDQATLDLRESLEQFEIQNVQLDIAKRKAQEANKVKSEFLANMSHELRTPLNGVIGFTRQVLKTPLSDTQRDYLQTIERSAANLLAIINDILDFSKLDAGKMVIEKIPFSLRESVEEALTLLAPSAHKKNIELSLRINPLLPDSFIGDAMRIKQILINLASNAIKFTDKGSVHIELDSEFLDDKSALLKATVIDTGIGMTKQQQETIFEAFGQADKSVTRLYGGTGLGLVISQRLVAEMSGELKLISEEGRGSTFWFTFECEVNQIPDNALPKPKPLRDKTVLYFESHTHSRIAVNEIMENWQMKVTPVTSLEEVSNALAQKKHYDYALIGHDVTPTELNELKGLINSIKPFISSIHLAINSNSPSLQEALIAAGAKSCISKPITPERLCKVLVPHNDTLAPETIFNNQKLPIKVLAVDDNDANLKLIDALLHEQVKEVTVATNGKEAVDLCKNEKFALIFMDIQMPVMDGISALNYIKTSTFNDETPIIAVTAHALSEEKDKLLKEGFDSYITKPIDEAMLKHIIYEHCDPQLLGQPALPLTTSMEQQTPITSTISDDTPPILASLIIDWSLALKRAGYKETLAKDMLHGLVDSLPETKQHISEALTTQDVEQLKILVHKLNGACCYSGVPALGKIIHQIETQLKKGAAIDNLEPEFFELFEHIENVLNDAPKVFETLNHIEQSK
ncbi:two-component sensor histidine kinase BarA [Thalassotalea piscium]